VETAGNRAWTGRPIIPEREAQRRLHEKERRWSLVAYGVCVLAALVVLAESEIWPNFLLACRRQGVPVAVVEQVAHVEPLANVVPSHIRVVEDLLAVAVGEHASLADQVAAVGDLQRLSELVVSQEDAEVMLLDGAADLVLGDDAELRAEERRTLEPFIGLDGGGMHLDETAYLRVLPVYAGGDVRWGLEPLVAMIDRAARSVRRQFHDAVTSVGPVAIGPRDPGSRGRRSR